MRASTASAILFADVAGSSQLYREQGDRQAQHLIGRVLADMSDTVTRRNGRVIKTIGDEIFCHFDSASDAMEAAIAIQRQRQKTQPRIDVRIGLHYGPVLHQGNDVFGEAVNDAAALVRIAKGGQIITSAHTVRELPERLKAHSRRFDRVRLKGASEASVIYVVDWAQESHASEATQMMSVITDTHTLPVQTSSLLELRYRDQRIALNPAQTPYIIGRDPGIAHLAINTTVASRDHCRIEFRRGKFVLLDNSTNGTWVRHDGQNTIYLRREELPLAGSGVISAGLALDDTNPHLIRFRL